MEFAKRGYLPAIYKHRLHELYKPGGECNICGGGLFYNNREVICYCGIKANKLPFIEPSVAEAQKLAGRVPSRPRISMSDWRTQVFMKIHKHWTNLPVYPRFIFIAGATGTGKTWYLQRLYHIFPAWTVFVPPTIASGDANGRFGGNISQLSRIADKIPVILLDDVGRETYGKAVEQLAAFIDTRSDASIPDGHLTVITSNLTIPMIKDLMSARVTSRLTPTRGENQAAVYIIDETVRVWYGNDKKEVL